MAYFPTASTGAFQRGASSTRTPGAHTEQMKVQGAQEGSYYADLAAHMAKISSAEEMEANRLDEMSRQFSEKLSEQVREFDITSEFRETQLESQERLGYAGISSSNYRARMSRDAQMDIAEMQDEFSRDKMGLSADLLREQYDQMYGDNQGNDILRATLDQQQSYFEDIATRTQTNPLLAGAAESSGPVVNDYTATSNPGATYISGTGRMSKESGAVGWDLSDQEALDESQWS